jgi:hypothetical protein
MSSTLSLPTCRCPRGTATLELVLSIPILLLVMALMVNVGTVACWKIRALSVARHEAWRARLDRIAYPYPRPDYWPAEAANGHDTAGHIPELDDPRIDQPVARGPVLFATQVNRDLLDPTRGLRSGWATLDRLYAMLAKMGKFHLRADSHLLDDKWQYHEMGIPRNDYRRVPFIYILPKEPSHFSDAYVQAARSLYFTFYYLPPLRDQLAPLDNDPDFRRYGPLVGMGVPDFHPHLNSFCTLERQIVDRYVKELILHIQGGISPGPPPRRIPDVAETMARSFVRLYQAVIDYYRDVLHQPPPPQFQSNIDILNRFLQLLGQ